MRNEPSIGEDSPHDGRKRGEGSLKPLGEIPDTPFFQIHLDLIPCLKTLGIADYRYKTHINGIAEEDAGEGASQYRSNAPFLQN
jgi:hypothetical protein